MTPEAIMMLSLSVALLTVKPGPGMVAVLSRAITQGFLPAFCLAMGLTTVQVLFFVLIVFGFSFAQAQMDFLEMSVKTLGSIFMIYLGVRGLMALDRGLWAQRKMRAYSLFESYLAGISVTLGNPFVISFYAAIVPNVLDLGALRMSGIMTGVAAIAVCNGGILALECALASQLREVLSSRTAVRTINLCASVAFIGVGLFLGYSILPVEFKLSL